MNEQLKENTKVFIFLIDVEAMDGNGDRLEFSQAGREKLGNTVKDLK
jgi:hypothetical protein